MNFKALIATYVIGQTSMEAKTEENKNPSRENEKDETSPFIFRRP